MNKTTARINKTTARIDATWPIFQLKLHLHLPDFGKIRKFFNFMCGKTFSTKMFLFCKYMMKGGRGIGSKMKAIEKIPSEISRNLR